MILMCSLSFEKKKWLAALLEEAINVFNPNWQDAGQVDSVAIKTYCKFVVTKSLQGHDMI